ncbi:DUF4129 domain-containing protein [Nocardioides sp.]|uniref:DUF4129 domain-containing protein n=1 Tax=Nocardioides sp. TaxID=35761 RepID=UPI0027360A4F|nr:DUF4129 domain-containing protein [Nocardioides sp.]MDP3892033.1 DUF4129 domain-containing protein [Nocardioides sp.]
MTPLPLGPPLDPSPDEARGELRRELIRPEYHEQDLIERLLRTLGRGLDAALDAASEAPPLSTAAALVVFALLALGLVWLVSRARRSTRAVRGREALLPDESVTAAELRSRAEEAFAQGRHSDALVDAFRALALRQVETGRIDDLPGATAHEVAIALATAHPHARMQVQRGADLFDEVLYGGRPASRDQAAEVLGLDGELAVLR